MVLVFYRVDIRPRDVWCYGLAPFGVGSKSRCIRVGYRICNGVRSGVYECPCGSTQT
jgi:hypothetical protein